MFCGKIRKKLHQTSLWLSGKANSKHRLIRLYQPQENQANVMLKAMNTLYIETSTEKSWIALSQNEIDFIYTPLSGGKELSKNLSLEVDKLLKSNNLKIEKIAVGEGPGSLTGIRVGSSLAQALAFGWNVPLFCFCSMKAFIPLKNGPFAVLVDARMGGVYTLTGTIDKGVLTQCSEVVLLGIKELEQTLKEIPLLVSPNPDLITKRLGRTCEEASLQFSTLDLKPLNPLP
jgi:tRNA threonylcarbamoyladenosine biosynthesis protein TsaB